MSRMMKFGCVWLVAGGLAISICALWAYLVFFPVGFADGLFKADPALVGRVDWGPWRQIEDLPRDSEIRFGPRKPVLFREGHYRSLFHEFIIIQAKSNSGTTPHDLRLLRSEMRLARVTGCNTVIAVVFLALFVLTIRSGRRDAH